METEQKPVFLDHTKSIEERVDDLLSRMTLEEKVMQMMYNAPAIDHLGIPAYSWWSECLHGVARAGRATIFPQAIGMGATFDKDLIYRIATAISDEARAMHHAAVKKGYRGRYAGLTFWTPNINIFRDPRWGRGQETYGEDPFLTGTLGSQFVKGLQGFHPKYLKAAACAKHYAVHSGPEKDRHTFDAKVSLKDLWETYLPAFKMLVDAGVEAIMGAYNRTNGEPCCGSKTLLLDILREKWGFRGHIVSDCGALVDFHEGHKVTATPEESAALALNNGCNLNCGSVFPHLIGAVEQDLITEEKIDESLRWLLPTRFKLGMFDPEEENPYTKISTDVINCELHRQLAREAAQKSIVLLKNENNALPLRKDIHSLYITGPHANSVNVLMGNYFGISDRMTTILEGIAASMEIGTIMEYAHGVLEDRDNVNQISNTFEDAHQADAIVAVLGISGLIEGEEVEAIASPAKGDKLDIAMPENQLKFLRDLRKGYDKPLIVVITTGSPLALEEVHQLADAVILAWYPGEEGGNAVADIIFGDVAPSGRLPITFPKSIKDIPGYDDYNMDGRTYQYMEKEPMYPFGFGLSYTSFEYSDAKLSSSQIAKGEVVELEITVKNTGAVAGDEIVQLYIKDMEASVKAPIQSLRGFKRVSLEAGESTTVAFTITPEMISIVDNSGNSVIEPGVFKAIVGGTSAGKRGQELGAAEMVEAVFTVK